jgi:transcriptional regulator with XRE-family HTH domain
MISSNQIKAARALVGVDQATIAKAAGISVNALSNMEANDFGPARGRGDTLLRVLRALEAHGALPVPGGVSLTPAAMNAIAQAPQGRRKAKGKIESGQGATMANRRGGEASEVNGP